MANPHPIKPAVADVPYHSKDAVSSAVRVGLIGGAAGFFSAAIQNSLAKQNVGAMGVFTRHGVTIGTYGMHATSAQLRSRHGPHTICPSNRG